jgi:hypothetical protein
MMNVLSFGSVFSPQFWHLLYPDPGSQSNADPDPDSHSKHWLWELFFGGNMLFKVHL